MAVRARSALKRFSVFLTRHKGGMICYDTSQGCCSARNTSLRETCKYAHHFIGQCNLLNLFGNVKFPLFFHEVREGKSLLHLDLLCYFHVSENPVLYLINPFFFLSYWDTNQ